MNVAGHLIVGAREEPFLAALLESLQDVVDVVLVNDNSGAGDSVNARVLAESPFARRGALEIDRAPFVNFAAARNRVLDMHRARGVGGWAAFIDADEVHRPAARRIARNLSALPDGIAVVDAYTRHYMQTFNWYTSIERRLSFFRVTPALRWENPVHERLAGVAGGALAIPYVYDHYGWVLPMRHQAEKGRQYAGLGQVGRTHDEAEVAALDPVAFFAPLWPRALRYRGSHPEPARRVGAELELRSSGAYALADQAIARSQSPAIRARNVVRRFNYEYRWRGRWFDARARRLLAAAEV
ncbi:MAG: glycosyltransferase [Candidatus Velthaea sp.]